MKLDQFPGFEYYGDQLADIVEMSRYKEFDEYQTFTSSTTIYPKDVELEYLMLGLMSEVGELAGKLKKEVRDGTVVTDEDFCKELGDILWYVARLADHREMFLSDVAKTNVEKLTSRQERGTIKGSGDER